MNPRTGFLATACIGMLAACGTAVDVPGPVEVRFENSEQAVVDQLKRLFDEARRNPDSAAARAALGMAYEMSGRSQAAHESYGQAALLEPEQPRWRYLEAVSLAELGDLEGALAGLDAVIELDATYAPAHLFRGQWLLDLGRIEEAGEAFSRAAELERVHPAPRIGLAKVQLRAGRPGEAIAILERLLAASPDDPHLYQLIGQAYRDSGDLSRARAALARASPQKSPTFPDPWRDERFEYQTGFAAGMIKASKLMKQGKVTEALALMEQLRIERPDDRQLLNNLSVAYRSAGQVESAFEVLREGLEHHPDYFPFHLNISSDYQRKGDVGQALEHLRRVVEIKPTLPTAWERIATIHLAAGNLEAALAAFEQASRHDPGSASYLVYSAVVLGRLGRWDEAIERLRRALEVNPNLANVEVTLAQALGEVGRFAEAREALARARALNGNPEQIDRAERRLSQQETGS